MEIELFPADVATKRTLKKIPGRKEDRNVINHEELAKIVSFERRDIVCDVMKSFIKFMKEVNMMANFGGEFLDWDPSKDEDTELKIAPLPKDIHPRQIGIAYFSFASNIIANWEEAYLKACVEFMNQQSSEKISEHDTHHERIDPEELRKTLHHEKLPFPSQNESNHFQNASDDLPSSSESTSSTFQGELQP